MAAHLRMYGGTCAQAVLRAPSLCCVHASQEGRRACRAAAFDVRAAHAVMPGVLQATNAADTISIVNAYMHYAYDGANSRVAALSDDAALYADSNDLATLESDIVCSAYSALARHGVLGYACARLRHAAAHFLGAAQAA